MHITEKQLKLVTEIASQEAIKAYRQHTERQQKEKYDRRLRNIKLLLRNYRSFVKHAKDIKLDIKVLDEKLELEFLDADEFAVEAIKRSKERTLVMVRFIAKMIAVYGMMCQDEGPEDIGRFEMLREMYILEPKKTMQDIADVHFVSVKTVKRNLDKAVETLAVLMFGVDGVKFK